MEKSRKREIKANINWKLELNELPEYDDLMKEMKFSPVKGVSEKQIAFAENVRKEEIEKVCEAYLWNLIEGDEDDRILYAKVIAMAKSAASINWDAKTWISKKGKLVSLLEKEASKRLGWS